MRQVSIAISLILFAAAGCKSASKNATPSASQPAAHTETKAESQAPAAKDEKKAEGTAAGSAKVECSHKADNRVLEVRNKDKGCELAYTKNGQEAVVSTSKNGRKHCEDSLEKIKGKLVAAGFTCK